MDSIIVDHEFNCRDALVPEDIMQLAGQIKQMGLLQPVVVRKLYTGDLRLVAGFRRYTACKRLKWETIPAIVRTDLSEIDAAALNLAENIERKNLTPLEEAKALHKLIKQGYESYQIADKLKRSETWVDSRLDILRLPPDVQKEVACGNLNLKQVRYLASLPESALYAAVRTIKDKKREMESSKIVKYGERGQKKPISRTTKGKPRSQKEMEAVRDYLYSLFGGDNIELAVLNWAAGIIPFGRLEEYIKEQAELFNVNYKPFEEV